MSGLRACGAFSLLALALIEMGCAGAFKANGVAGRLPGETATVIECYYRSGHVGSVNILSVDGQAVPGRFTAVEVVPGEHTFRIEFEHVVETHNTVEDLFSTETRSSPFSPAHLWEPWEPRSSESGLPLRVDWQLSPDSQGGAIGGLVQGIADAIVRTWVFESTHGTRVSVDAQAGGQYLIKGKMFLADQYVDEISWFSADDLEWEWLPEVEDVTGLPRLRTFGKPLSVLEPSVRGRVDVLRDTVTGGDRQIAPGESVQGILRSGERANAPGRHSRRGYNHDGLAFSATAGDEVEIEVVANFKVYVYLIDPEGEIVDSTRGGMSSSGRLALIDETLMTTGLHRIIVTSAHRGADGFYAVPLR